MPQIIDVREQGATGDNATDDTDSIQSCIDRAQELYRSEGARSVVYLPPGIYLTSRPLAISQQAVELRGAGRSTTQLRRVGQSFGPGLILANRKTYEARPLPLAPSRLLGPGHLIAGTNMVAASASEVSCRNLSGVFTVSGGSRGEPVPFDHTEADTGFELVITPCSASGSPAPGSNRLEGYTKERTGFTPTLETAPGAGNTRSFVWLMTG